MDYNPKRNYFFRVRTVLDQQGNIESALHGYLGTDKGQKSVINSFCVGHSPIFPLYIGWLP